MFRLWNRLISINNTRLTKRVFNTDYNTSRKTWCSEIKFILEQLNMQHNFVNKQAVDLERVENFLGTIYQRDWNEKLTTVSKLRTYVTFKSNYIRLKSI